MYKLNFDVMKEEFFRRCKENQDKQIDNSSLRAGAPMYYYCYGCGVLVATKPEGWFGESPERYCEGCKILADHGMLDRLKKEIGQCPA